MNFNDTMKQIERAMDADGKREELKLKKDLRLLLSKQTEQEREAAMSLLRNNEGFNRWDAHLLTRIANKIQRTGEVTDRQLACIQKKLAKYHKQIGALRVQHLQQPLF